MTGDVVKFITVVEQRGDGWISIGEVAREVGLTPKLLQRLCKCHFGITPRKYLTRHRLTLARRMLERGSSVTAAATEYEFWQLGRFAHEYKKLFGELPSSTRGHHAYHTGSS